MFLFEKPNEDEASNEADNSFMIKLGIIFGCGNIVGELDFSATDNPGIPFGKFGVELFGKKFR